MQITRRTLERIITNNYVKNFNWAERGPKKAFKVLKIKNLIIGSSFSSFFKTVLTIKLNYNEIKPIMSNTKLLRLHKDVIYYEVNKELIHGTF